MHSGIHNRKPAQDGNKRIEYDYIYINFNWLFLAKDDIYPIYLREDNPKSREL